MLSQLPLRLAINDASTSQWSIAAAAKQSVSVFAAADVDLAMKENTGEMAHSRLVVPETQLICNHNFV